jgi:hypothetical protein
LPAVSQTDNRHTFLTDDLSFLPWLNLMPMREAQVSFADNLVHSFITATLTESRLEASLIRAFRANDL